MALNRSRILACSAEWHILRLIEVNLQRQDYEVEKSTSGSEALRKLKESTFAAVVVDANLPDMSGQDLVEAIRNDPETANVRVMLLGNDGEPPDRGGSGPDLFVTRWAVL